MTSEVEGVRPTGKSISVSVRVCVCAQSGSKVRRSLKRHLIPVPFSLLHREPSLVALRELARPSGNT